jgi:cobalt-zinc-cadmium efflux system protein
MQLTVTQCPSLNPIERGKFLVSSHPSESPHQPEVQALQLSLGMLLSLFLVELIVGHVSNSLSLVADAGHVILDAFAIGTSLFANRLTRYLRSLSSPSLASIQVELWATLFNGATLLAIAVGIALEAIHRLHSETSEILGLPMLFAALIGLGVNGVNAFWLKGCSHHSLNLKSAFLHVLADGISSAGVLLGAIAISLWHWVWIDSAISFLVSGLMFVMTIPLIWQGLRQLFFTAAPPLKTNCQCRQHDLEKWLFPTLEDVIS